MYGSIHTENGCAGPSCCPQGAPYQYGSRRWGHDEIVGVEDGVLLRKYRPAREVLALAEELYAALDADKTIEPSVERLIRRQMEGIIQALTESDKTLDSN